MQQHCTHENSEENEFKVRVLEAYTVWLKRLKKGYAVRKDVLKGKAILRCSHVKKEKNCNEPYA